MKLIFIAIVAIILLLGGLFAIRAFGLSNKIFVGENSNVYEKIGSFLSSQVGLTKLIGEEQGQINILLLGIGGEGHDGPYLSDTIIVAQIRPDDKQVSMVSIPRDYLVKFKNGYYGKINNVFSDGYTKNKNWNEGGAEIRKTAEEISGLTIPYFAVVDFQGFTKLIDALDGIDVNIERSFTDYSFPNDSGGYLKPVSFKAGTEHMDGTRALIFARSRHASGTEGSDFARSLRQQKIIQATKEKAAQINFVTNIGTVNKIAGIVGDHAHTNLNPGELFHLYTLVKDYNGENVVSLSLDPSTGLVCNGKIEETGAFVVEPCDGVTKNDIKEFFAKSFSSGKMSEEKSIIWMADTSQSQTLYKPAEKLLQDKGFTVYKMNYGGKSLTQNVVYEVNNKPATLSFIKEQIKASAVTIPPPGVKISKDKVDLILLLGDSSFIKK